MRFEKNWRQMTLEDLEKNIWPDVQKDDQSHLVSTCHALRKKPLLEFSVEELRIMIGQNIGLEYLIPIALEELKKDILAEGDLYEGDLLTAVLKADPEYWNRKKKNRYILYGLIQEEFSALENADTPRSVKKDWFDWIERFEDQKRKGL
jgi:hypothetical protein